MEHRNGQYHDMPSLQERPITLGELLRREEIGDTPEQPAPRSMGRTMSPTRSLGSLANGRPRRARGRTQSRPSASINFDDENTIDFEEYRHPLNRPPNSLLNISPMGPLSIAGLVRWRNETAEARIRNFLYLMNGPYPDRRWGNNTRPRHHRVAGSSSSSDYSFNPFAVHRIGLSGRHSRTRSNAGFRSNLILHRHSHRTRSSIGRSRRGYRYDPRESRLIPRTSSYRYLRAGRPRTVRPNTGSNGAAGNSVSEISPSMRRFIDFTAEFIPVELPPPDAEPPEWSLDITAAAFGPFAIGRSAVSRARSLAIMGALSQVDDEESGRNRPNPDENE